jgi:hypothetical protein
MPENINNFEFSKKDEPQQDNQKSGEDKRTGKDRRKFSFGYPGSDRRKGKDRRKQDS